MIGDTRRRLLLWKSPLPRGREAATQGAMPLPPMSVHQRRRPEYVHVRDARPKRCHPVHASVITLALVDAADRCPLLTQHVALPTIPALPTYWREATRRGVSLRGPSINSCDTISSGYLDRPQGHAQAAKVRGGSRARQLPGGSIV